MKDFLSCNIFLQLWSNSENREAEIRGEFITLSQEKILFPMREPSLKFPTNGALVNDPQTVTPFCEMLTSAGVPSEEKSARWPPRLE